MLAETQFADGRIHILPILLTVSPTLIGTGVKWMQDNSKSRQRTQLADRLSGLTKVYTEQCQGEDPPLAIARTALAAEINAVCNELLTLQTETKRAVHRSLSTWITDMLLLFRPHGLLAWVVHLAFYSELLFLPLGLLGIIVDRSGTDTSSALLGFFIFGLFMFGLQRWAIWLRKRGQPVAVPPPPRPVAVPPPVQA